MKCYVKQPNKIKLIAYETLVQLLPVIESAAVPPVMAAAAKGDSAVGGETSESTA